MAKNYSNKENNRNMANNNASENGYSSYADEAWIFPAAYL